VLFQGQKRIWSKFANGGGYQWNDMLSKRDQLWNVIGQFLMKERKGSRDDTEFDLAGSGMKLK